MAFGSKQPETGIGVKKAGQVEYVSKDEWEARIKAIAQSKRDIAWWAEHFFHIITLDKGLTRIKLYDKQRELLQHIANNNRIVTLAARQTGKSTTYTIFCLWYATLFADKKIMICANKLATAIEIMDRIRKAYENLPFYIKPGILTYNKGAIEFANGSSIRATSTSSSASRGSSCNCLIIDEMAFIPKGIINDFWASTIPIVSSSKTSKIIVVSTPNGADGLYYDIWQQANKKDQTGNEEGWKPFRIHWFEAGGIRDEAWKKQQIASIGIERWKQEFECDFLTSATKRLLPDDVIERHRIAMSELKTQHRAFYDGKTQHIVSQDETQMYEFKMWHEFDPQRTYAASGDVAEGGGGDWSVLYIWDVTDLRNITMCAKFESNKVSLSEFAYITTKLLGLYNDPYYICERNGLGAGYIDALRITYGYTKIVTEGKRGEHGIYSHISTKSKACLWARDMMTTDGFGFTLYDKDLVDEFSTFVKRDTRGGAYASYAALPSAHDDHMMAFIWLCWLLQSDVVEKYFLVCETFTSALGSIFARTLQPTEAYTSQAIKRITNDPTYQDFLDFKEEVMDKLTKAHMLESTRHDQFGYGEVDPYFGGMLHEPSWRSSLPAQLQNAQDLNPNNRMPAFFVN